MPRHSGGNCGHDGNSSGDGQDPWRTKKATRRSTSLLSFRILTLSASTRESSIRYALSMRRRTFCVIPQFCSPVTLVTAVTLSISIYPLTLVNLNPSVFEWRNLRNHCNLVTIRLRRGYREKGVDSIPDVLFSPTRNGLPTDLHLSNAQNFG